MSGEKKGATFTMAISVAVSWPGVISFLLLLALGLTDLRYYTRLRRPRSAWFWATGIAVCILLAYAITVLAVVPLLLRAAAGTGDLRQGAATGRVSPGQAGQAKEILLEFTPEPVKELPTGKPETAWKEAESLNLAGKIGEDQVHVSLYVESGEQENFLQGEVRAILETEAGSFDLGVVSNYGLHGADIRSRDVNDDGQNELVLTGGMGAAYGERKIIGYDSAEKRWVKLLTMGTPYDSDIDGDGRDDVVAVSGGSLPGYVWIYRWNKDHFEKADVAESTGNVYASINRLDGTVWIEAGKPNEPHYYQYRNGKLVEIPKPPVS